MIAGSPSLCVVLMEQNTSGHGVGNHEYNFFEHIQTYCKALQDRTLTTQ